jgi:hypothetical protein
VPSAFAIPILRRNQYEAFRREVGSDLANTYDGWLEYLGDRRVEATKRGETMVEVEIDFDHFMMFCRTRGRNPNLKALLYFAVEKSTGQKG